MLSLIFLTEGFACSNTLIESPCCFASPQIVSPDLTVSCSALTACVVTANKLKALTAPAKTPRDRWLFE